jgi:hypothetical protein
MCNSIVVFLQNVQGMIPLFILLMVDVGSMDQSFVKYLALLSVWGWNEVGILISQPKSFHNDCGKD